MDRMTMRIGTVWMLLNLAAAGFLAPEFLVHEIRSRIEARHDRDAKSTAAPHHC